MLALPKHQPRHQVICNALKTAFLGVSYGIPNFEETLQWRFG